MWNVQILKNFTFQQRLNLLRKFITLWAVRDLHPRSPEDDRFTVCCVSCSANRPVPDFIEDPRFRFYRNRDKTILAKNRIYSIVFWCLRLHSSIFLWLPDISTSGTRHLLKTSGRVY